MYSDIVAVCYLSKECLLKIIFSTCFIFSQFNVNSNQNQTTSFKIRDKQKFNFIPVNQTFLYTFENHRNSYLSFYERTFSLFFIYIRQFNHNNKSINIKHKINCITNTNSFIVYVPTQNITSCSMLHFTLHFYGTTT